jgi:hypothetical protein
VAPERLRRGILDLLPDAGSVPERLLHEFSWLQQGHQAWDALNAWWGTQVVAYNYSSQLRLLDSLGFGNPGWQQLGWLVAATLTAGLLIIGWQFGRVRPARGPDRLARAYLRLCARLARNAVPRQPHQGPLAYAATLDDSSDLTAQAAQLLHLYARLRFGSATPSAAQLRDFERRVSRWRAPRRRARASRET